MDAITLRTEVEFNTFLQNAITSKFHQGHPAVEIVTTRWQEILRWGLCNAGLEDWQFQPLDDQVEILRVKAVFETVIAGIQTTPFRLHKADAELTDLAFKMKYLFEEIAIRPTLTEEERRALFYETNPELNGKVIRELVAILHHLWEQVTAPDSPYDALSARMVIGNTMGLLPFFLGQELHSSLELPQQINGVWQLVQFQVHEFQSDQLLHLSPVMAYGLTPQNNPDAHPIFLFHGTPPLATSGAALSYLSDYTPGVNVGALIYNRSSEQILQWVDQQQKVIHAYGISLGGALCYHLGRDRPEKVHVHTFVSPGFHFPDGLNAVVGEHFCHANDFISDSGFHPEGDQFQFYRVFTGQPRSWHVAHQRVAGGFDGSTVILKMDPFKENRRFQRKLITALHVTVSIVFSLIVWPIVVVWYIILKMYEAFSACYEATTSRSDPREVPV